MQKRTTLAITALLLSLCAIAPVTAAAAVVNYDTAWTFVYDGGRDSAIGKVYSDDFYEGTKDGGALLL